MNYDFSAFHKGHNKVVNVFPDGAHVTCLDCGVSANIEAISGKVSPSEVCKGSNEVRKVEGDQSKGVDKGGLVI